MGIFNSDGTQDYPATVQLNAPIDADRRMRYFEQPLLEAFEREFPGSRIEEGRTLVDSADQPVSADLEIVLRLDSEDLVAEVGRFTDLLNKLGTPEGSWLRLGELEESQAFPVGVTGGLVVVIPDPSPEELAADAQAGLDEFGAALRAALASDERVLGLQELSGESRVHLYSPDVSAMADRVGAVVDASPIPGVTLLPVMAEPDEDSEWVAVDETEIEQPETV